MKAFRTATRRLLTARLFDQRLAMAMRSQSTMTQASSTFKPLRSRFEVSPQQKHWMMSTHSGMESVSHSPSRNDAQHQSVDEVDKYTRQIQSGNVIPELGQCYAVVRFLAGKGDVVRLERLLDAMTIKGARLDFMFLDQAIYCYLLVGMVDKAEHIVHRMVRTIDPRKPKDTSLLGECTFRILFAYRKIVLQSSNANYKVESVERAHTLMKQVLQKCDLLTSSKERILSAMMDLFTHAGQLDEAQRIFYSLDKRNEIFYGIMIKAFGNNDMADKATDMLHLLLDDKDAKPSEKAFAQVVDAWAKSSKPDAFDQASSILRLMEDHPACSKYGIRPNFVVYSTLFKCLAASKREDAGERAETLLNDMEMKYASGDGGLKPNEFSFSLGIKTCFQVGDLKRAETIMQRMEQSSTPPNLRTYTVILRHYAKIDTVDAADRAEQILFQLRKLGKRNLTLKPDGFTYSLVLSAWKRVGKIDRMLYIFDQMKEDTCDVDFVILTDVIPALAATGDRAHVKRADDLVKEMERSEKPDLYPDQRHYNPLINGWLAVGDADRATRVIIRQCEFYITKKHSSASSPDAIYLDKVMQGWIKANNLDSATLFIDTIERLFTAKLIPVGPEIRTYENLLSAWRISSNPERKKKCKRITSFLHDLKRKKKSAVQS